MFCSFADVKVTTLGEARNTVANIPFIANAPDDSQINNVLTEMSNKDTDISSTPSTSKSCT